MTIKDPQITFARRGFLKTTLGLTVAGLYGCDNVGKNSGSFTELSGSSSAASNSASSISKSSSSSKSSASSISTSSASSIAESSSSAVSSASASSVSSSTSSSSAASQARIFKHPGLLHTEEDFDRMKAKVTASAQPWLDGWNALTSNGRAQLGASPRPLAVVTRSAALNNSPQMYIDIDRAYQLALRWKVTGNNAYADLAVVFLNAWSSTLVAIEGNADRYLAAGIYGYQFANAAEIMRTYSGWEAADFARFQNMILTVFYPHSSRFLVTHNDAVITNYWANWDQCALACVLATGVLCDREDIYDEALNYYKFGQGNGAALQAVYHVHPGYLGQWQESGRDQGHCTLGIGLAGAFCEMAWNQGDDMYGYDNNRFLAGAEYVAKSNLRDANGNFYSMPWFDHNGRQGLKTGVSGAGMGSIRPVWESVYNHYVKRRGLAAPYVALQVAQLHPERDGGNGDQLGFGTLTFSRDPLVTNNSPSGVTAYLRGSAVLLSWWGVAGASSYNVKRATSPGGPFSIIASSISDLLSYTDASIVPGLTYYYLITAETSAGESVPSPVSRVATSPELLHHIAFDEGSGTFASDAVGTWTPSTFVNDPTWTAGQFGNAVKLDGVDDHIALPPDPIPNLADFTMAARIYVDASLTWARVFDLGSGQRRWMMLTIKNNHGLPCYSIDTIHGYVTQSVEGATALPTGQWVHIAVTLSGTTGTLYVNGIATGSNASMTLAPYHLGPPTSSYLGRSQFNTDPYFKGKVDDFRLYHGALTPAQVAALV